MMKSIVLVGMMTLAAAAVAATSTPAGWTDDYALALKRAGEEKKLVLADFSGSDWCVWCQKLDSEVFNTDAFRAGAVEKYVLLMVDSPRDKNCLSEKAKTQNPELAKKYAVRGFPTVLILDAKGEVVYRTGYERGGPEAYLKMLEEGIRLAPDVAKYIKPIEALLTTADEGLKNELKTSQSEIMKKLSSLDANLSAKEKKRQLNKLIKEAENAFFESFPKFIPVFEKTLADAKAMCVPKELESRKMGLIEGHERMFESLKRQHADYLESLKNPKPEADEEEDEEEEDEPFRRSRSAPRLVVPLPEEAKTDEDYFRTVAEPFYMARLVEAYRPAADVKPDVADRVRAVRKALARALITGREEFPTHDEFEMAHRLWRENCRDAAVAIVHSDGLPGETRYFQSEKLFQEAVAAFDFDADPFVGFLLRLSDARTGHYRISRNAKVNRKPIKAAELACSNAFVRVAEVFRSADPRILERLYMTWGLPDGAAELVGDDYLAKCRQAKICMARASEERGSGWGSDLTDKQVEGWRNYNDEARSNLTAAVAMRPDDPLALMRLSSLNARSCGKGDAIALMNRAVSNSLDSSAQSIGSVLHYQTSRWGGSTEFLLDAVRAASTNVCTSSTFAYRAAAAAISKIFVAETDHVANTNLVNFVLTPEIAAGLYSMFDAYIAAPESPYMPSRDVFVGMAVALSLQRHDWRTARKYFALYRKPLNSWQDAWWLRKASHSSHRLYLYNLFEAIGTNRERGGLFLDAEIAIEEGRYDEADAIYRKIRGAKGLGYGEKVISGRQGFKVRKIVQEARGGWVDVMPTENAYEAETWWSVLATQKDGRAHMKANKGYYRLELPLPGRNAEYEATVHFETNDVKQTRWFIGWGLARPYTGFCATKSSWAYPYIGFRRDETGDWVSVECPTRENTAKSYVGPKAKYGEDKGYNAKWTVYEGALEKHDSHSFSLAFGSEDLSVTVDGKVVWKTPVEEALSQYQLRDNIQPDGTVLPVWKTFKNTSFGGYRYRRLQVEEPKGDDAVRRLTGSLDVGKSYSGGWGYSSKDAVVLSAANETEGVGLERPFVRLRCEREAKAFAESKGTTVDVVVPRELSQSLRTVDGKNYDVMEVEVYVEFEDGGTETYKTEVWFDISAFFGKF